MVDEGVTVRDEVQETKESEPEALNRSDATAEAHDVGRAAQSTKMDVPQGNAGAESESAGGALWRSSSGPWRSRKEIIAKLSSRIIDEQRPIHVLQALRWESWIEETFRQAHGRELPKVDLEYWSKIDLGFDPVQKMLAYEQIANDVERELTTSDGVGAILHQTAIEYRDVVRMLAARGTPAFHRYSSGLYGSPKDTMLSDGVTVRELGLATYDLFARMGACRAACVADRNISAERAVDLLAARLRSFFGDVGIQVVLDPDVLADATAGPDYVKIRQGAVFSMSDIDVLEVHEGWVHLATTLNGQAQPVARWLGKGSPRTVATQEGLAALMEILSGRCHLLRAQKLNDRILAIDKAEDGANFLEVYEWYRTEGYAEDACFCNARRVFRGGVVEGGAPFTKDISYGKGLALCFAFLQSAVQAGKLDHVSLLFLGKLSLDDIPVLEEHVASGTIHPPTFLPPIVRDPNGLVTSMAFGMLLTHGCAAIRGARR